MIPTALQSPFRRQWDPDSRLPPPDPGTAPGNCGMTCVAVLIQFYRDQWRGIYAVRRLSTTRDWEMFTRISDQSLSLAKGGVPNVIDRPSVSSIRSRVSTGRWPVIVGLKMSLVPESVAGHPFRGNHAVIIRAAVTRNGVRGFYVLDPNFNRTHRIDPTGGRRFYSEEIIQRAYYNAGLWALVPTKAKLVSVPLIVPSEAQEMAILARIQFENPRDFNVRKDTVLRRGPGTQYAEHYKVPGDITYTLLGWALDANDKRTGWVLAYNKRGDRTGAFFVPPVH